MVINYRKLNPNGFYLLQYMREETIRFIIMYGGSSSGKSFSVAQCTLIQTLADGENAIVMRKVGASIEKTIYEDFKVAALGLGISNLFVFRQNKIKCVLNDAKIDFSGLDDPEKIKGISNYKRVVLDEWSEFDETDFKQIRKRLRGKRGQQVICCFNPISETHWIKKQFFDAETWNDVPMKVSIAGKELPEDLVKVKSLRINSPKHIMNVRTGEIEEHPSDTICIQSTYLNNFWVIGSPDGKYGFYDEQCVADFERDRINDPDYYRVYALGEWGVLRTGSEFLGSFNIGKHTREVSYDNTLPIHLSVDNNVLPYISISYWQISFDNEKAKLWQLHETCAESPNNTVRKAAAIATQYLQSLNYTEKVYLHGDASTRAANTIDENKRSWLDLFIETLRRKGVEVEDVVGDKNPPVAMTGEFINAIFTREWPKAEIIIGNNCSVSISDYLAVQKDANGAILKTKVKNKVTKQSYEEHGHLTDTFRYVVHDLLRSQYTEFSNRRKRNLYASDGTIQFFNPSAEYAYTNEVLFVMPNVAGKFVLLLAKGLGEVWHITDCAFKDSVSTDEMAETISSFKCKTVYIECSQAYYSFVRSLRYNYNLEVRLHKENTDVVNRISATSDFVRSNILFSESKTYGGEQYAAMMENLMDYNQSNEIMEASTAISGLAQILAKLCKK